MSKLSLTLVAFLVVSTFARARPTGDVAGDFAANYENLAHGALSRYFDDGTFLVRATVELLDDEDLPALPAGGGLGTLPGLPGLPAGGFSVPSEEQIASVQLEILVDTTYTARDRDFIEYLVSLAADLDTGRGDLIHVRRTFFPRDNRAVGQHRRTDPPWIDPPPTLPKSAASDTSSPLPPPSLRDPAAEMTDRLFEILPLVLVCFTALACAWILGRAILSGRGDSEERILSRLGAWRKRRKEETPIRPAVSLPEARPAPPTAPSPPPAPAPAASPSINQRHALLDALVGDPRLSGQVLRHWILRDNRKGTAHAVALLSATDPQLLAMLREVLGPEATRAIEAGLNAETPFSEDETTSAARTFLRDFRKASQRQGETPDSELFGFLDQLNETQIAYVLKGESAGVVGFALTQIAPEKTSAILARLEPAARARLLVGMGNVSQIPREVCREMADRLSLKAMEATNMQFVAADGLESILKLIDGLPLDEQFGYIHAIGELDIHLARRLRERTVTFAELGSLPDRFLGPRLQALDPDTLALALLRAESGLRDKLLSLLPERQRLMMQSAMEARRQSPRDELDAAARRLLKSIRDEIRRQGRPQ